MINRRNSNTSRRIRQVIFQQSFYKYLPVINFTSVPRENSTAKNNEIKPTRKSSSYKKTKLNKSTSGFLILGENERPDRHIPYRI